MTYEKIVEKAFSYKGYQCYIVFLPSGWRCGYVGIPEAKKKDIDYDYLSCHGGITYNESTCPIPGVSAPDFWWIGFDCAHGGDQVDLEAAKKYYGHTNFVIPSMHGQIRMVEYCEKELKFIVDQLVEA